MTNMLTAVAKGGEGIEGIAIHSVPIPVAGPGEALVRLKAAFDAEEAKRMAVTEDHWDVVLEPAP